MKEIIKQQFTDNKESWIKSFQSGLSQDIDGNFLPWYTYPAINHLKKTIKPTDTIFEFGSGSSTIFYAHLAKKVTSIETNPKWLNIVSKTLNSKNLKNFHINLMEDGISSNEYQIFPNRSKEKFDIIIIDSIKRYQCAINSLNYLKAAGIIILDDSQRTNYKKIFDFYKQKGFSAKNFIGIEPGKLKIKHTTIFYKS